MIIASLFLNLSITGYYCQSGSTMGAAIIALLMQKFMLIILNLLMVKRPKRKYNKIDPKITLERKEDK